MTMLFEGLMVFILQIYKYFLDIRVIYMVCGLENSGVSWKYPYCRRFGDSKMMLSAKFSFR